MHAPCIPGPWKNALGEYPAKSKHIPVIIDLISRPGRGALVLHGNFWYPALVIQRNGPDAWVVRWWRACQFELGGIEPGSTSIVFLAQIVDSLWLKQEERRQIRVSLISLNFILIN